MPFDDYFPQFEQFMLEINRRPRTISGYIRDLRVFARWLRKKHHGAAPTLTDITPLDVREYRDYLHHTRKLKPATINRRLSGLRVYLEFAVEKNLLAHNPAAKIPGLKQVPHTPRWLTPAEQRKLRRAFDREVQTALAENTGEISARGQLALRNRALFLLLLNTGLRAMEALRLTMEDIDLADRRGSVFIRDGKGGKSRSMPLNREARRALQEYLAVRPNLPSDKFFVGQRGPISNRQLQRILKKYARLAKLDRELANIHVLRHTFGKNLVDAGVPLDRVATLLGHASLNTTRLYTTPDENDLQRAVERLANV